MDDARVPFTEAASAAPARLPLRAWLIEGLRTGFFMRPRVALAQPTPSQIAALLAVLSILEIGLARLEVAGAASFDLRDWLAPWWSTGALLLLAWWALPSAPAHGGGRPAGLAAWFALWTVAVVPANTVSQLLGIAQAQGLLPQLADSFPAAAWLVYLALWAWIIAAVLRLTARFGAQPPRLAVLGLGMMILFATAAVQFPDGPWQSEETGGQRPRLVLSQDVFEAQQALWRKTSESIASERPGRVELYALVFSPDALQDVFLRESSMVTAVLARHFDAGAHVIQLANHPATARSYPWATPLNLERGIEILAQRMDRERDVLLVYLTSHGAADFRLAASNEPLEVEPIGPADLRRMLDRAGIRNRVIVVSACYSGGWIAPLAGDTTLVMTASAADKSSYGCGRLSELTFFGRALFDEQLRRTHSFEQAFAAALPVIRRREADAGKTDGFSDPQISVGARIRPVLRELERTLESPADSPR